MRRVVETTKVSGARIKISLKNINKIMAGGSSGNNRLQSGRKPTVGQVRKIVKGALNRDKETGVHTFGSAGSDVTTTASFFDLALIGQGSTNVLRIGNRIKPMSLNLKFLVQGVDSTNILRIMIVKGYRTLTAADGPSSIAAVFDRDDGLVMFDRLYGTDATAGPNVHSENLHLFPKGDIHYDGSSTTSLRGGLYFFLVSDSGAVAHPQIVFQGILYFKDV